jgi:hypothetical protein
MGLHDHYYGKDAEPANNNQEGPWCGPEHARMSAGLADLRKVLGMKEPEEEMRADSYEVMTSKPRIRPARNYRDEVGGDDA